MLIFKKEIALSRKKLPIYDIWYYAIVIITLASLVVAGISYSIYTAHTHNVDRDLSLKTSSIEKAFSELMEETNRILSYAGRQIIRFDKAKDLNYIAKFLAQVWEADFKAKSCITFVEWLDDKNMQLVNSQTGVIPDPVDMSFRIHTKECRKQPWVLQVSPPDIGIPSGLWVIPAGIGIFDTDKNKFSGILVVGISVAAITSKITELAQADQVSFLILDYQGNVILQTQDNELDPKKPFYKEKLSELQPMPRQGLLKTQLHHNNIEYRFYCKMHNLPYVILVGRHSAVFKREFCALILPRILEFSGIPIFCLLLLFLFRRHLIHFSNLSYRTRENFLHTFNEDFFILSEIILRRLRIFLKSSIKDSCQLRIVERIYNDVIELKQLSTNDTQIVPIDVNKALEESVLVISQLVFLQSKKITYEFQPNIPKFDANELRFKQIVLSLLSMAMEGTKEGCEILMRAHVEITEHGKQLIIHIRDNGFGLSSFEMKRLRESQDFPPSQHLNGAELDIQEIIGFVEMYGGSFQEFSAIKKGLNIQLVLPYAAISEKGDDLQKKSNIYPFPHKD